MSSISEEIQKYYASGVEAERLAAGRGQLEGLRTQEILGRYLPAPPGRVLDVGGGAGVHALWLLEHGYDVELTDPSPLHVEQASAAFAAAGYTRGSAHLGDARELDAADASVAAALLLGPLYHLTERTDRITSLRQVSRALKPGGVVIVAAISRFASLLDGYSRDLVADPEFVRIVERDLVDGQHRNPTDRQDYFTTAYFHHPRELRAELTEAGLQVETILAVEGPFWMLGNFDAVWADAARREHLLDFLRRIEADEAMLGVSAHLVVVARKP